VGILFERIIKYIKIFVGEPHVKIKGEKPNLVHECAQVQVHVNGVSASVIVNRFNRGKIANVLRQ